MDYGEQNELSRTLGMLDVVVKLVARIRSVLGERLVGVYLYGSLVWGDFDVEVSDIDLLAATDGVVDERELGELEGMHREIAGEWPDWDNRIEVQYQSLEGLRTFRERKSWMGNISPGEPLHMVEAGREWLLNWYFVREKGVVLWGPDPKEIIPVITKDEYLVSVRDHMEGWREWIEGTRDSRPYQGYAILTACRALYTARNGEQVSKKKAAEWAAKELPKWAGLIGEALRWREEAKGMGEVDTEESYGRAVEFVGVVREMIEIP